ncbi:DUF2975 domain-containing protein [Motiliproteus sp. MSK22-1]|uniref:DUF2975 domain-containing protein n=1 Tax=Motiliproteus sp. MSK22-1 TaxID=1897630 RepID=UPI0009786EB8|nr:DUF2975 domain-containing protein [Motiliproteus sp. MSK22-1]OMH33906.1 DUF2975 domain-containing protein [Motiliproteus sp. MSK22-1]
MSNIQKQSRRVRLFLQLLFFVIPAGVVYFWLTAQTEFDLLTKAGVIQLSFNIDSLTQLNLSYTTRLLAAFASLLVASIVLYALSILIRLFRNYENGNIFTQENARYYQKLGYCLFYWVAGGVIYGGAISVILSFNNPPGERILSLGFAGIDFLTIVLGFLVLIISWVMKEAYQIADENSQTI